MPELVWAEVASALRRYVLAERIREGRAGAIVADLLELPLEAHRLADLAPLALRRSVETGISAYDAFYVALAEAADAVLVTADRRLADVAPHATLIA